MARPAGALPGPSRGVACKVRMIRLIRAPRRLLPAGLRLPGPTEAALRLVALRRYLPEIRFLGDT